MPLNPRSAVRRLPLPTKRTVRRGLGALTILAVGTAASWFGGRSFAGSVETAASTTSTFAPVPLAVGATTTDWKAAHPTEIADARAKVDAARTAAAAVAASPTVPSTLYDVAGDAGQALRDLAWAVPASVVDGVATKQRWLDCSGELFGLALAAVELNREPNDAAVTGFQAAYEGAQACLVDLP
jgi:hypothetical protein